MCVPAQIVFALGFIFVCLAFVSPSWIEIIDDRDATGQLEKFGLWMQCFRYVPLRAQPVPMPTLMENYTLVGCTSSVNTINPVGYDKLRGIPAAPCE